MSGFRVLLAVMLCVSSAAFLSACGGEENDGSAMLNISEVSEDSEAETDAAGAADQNAYEVASGVCGKDASWTLDSAGTLTIQGTGNIEIHDAESTANGFSDEIRPQICSLVIENGVTGIGMGAFSYCENLEKLSIPDSVESIEHNAFSGCESLKKVRLSKYVTEINGSPFRTECGSLTEITVDSENMNYCSSRGALYSKDMTTLIDVPGAIKEFEVPSTVTEIYALFSSCRNLKKITVTEGNSAFCAADGVLYDKDMNTVVSIPGSTKNIEIPDGITEIGTGAFSYCDSLKNVILPDSIKRIGTTAFSHCGNLESIILPDGVDDISGFAFTGCENLKNIVLPDSVTKISDLNVFSGCDNLTDVYYAGTEREWRGIEVYSGYYYSEDNINNTNMAEEPQLSGNVNIHYNAEIAS